MLHEKPKKWTSYDMLCSSRNATDTCKMARRPIQKMSLKHTSRSHSDGDLSKKTNDPKLSYRQLIYFFWDEVKSKMYVGTIEQFQNTEQLKKKVQSVEEIRWSSCFTKGSLRVPFMTAIVVIKKIVDTTDVCSIHLRAIYCRFQKNFDLLPCFLFLRAIRKYDTDCLYILYSLF